MYKLFSSIRYCARCGKQNSMYDYGPNLVLQALDDPPSGWTEVTMWYKQGRYSYQFCSTRCARKFIKKNFK